MTLAEGSIALARRPAGMFLHIAAPSKATPNAGQTMSTPGSHASASSKPATTIPLSDLTGTIVFSQAGGRFGDETIFIA